MKEVMKRVSSQQAQKLLHNKFIVILGDSIQRSVYKDLILLLQKDKYLTKGQLRKKGEMSFEQDCLVEGGCLNEMHNGTQYHEVRQFQSDHHLVRFYFVTRIYSRYMQSILEDFCRGLKPDLVIINSCVWDISRYNLNWSDDYTENLHKFFGELKQVLPEESLVIWNLTMPLGERIKGGFLVPEIEQRAASLRYDVVDANFHSRTLADAYGMDVIDLHFQFRSSLHHRTKDGVHWNALAHRRITSLLLQHTAQAWGVVMHCPLTTVEHTEFTAQPVYENTTRHNTRPSETNYNGHSEEFHRFSLPFGYLSFENTPQPPTYKAAQVYRPVPPPPPHQPIYRHKYADVHYGNGFNRRPSHHFEPYNGYHHQSVMKHRHRRHHYAPYPYHRPSHYSHHGHYY